MTCRQCVCVCVVFACCKQSNPYEASLSHVLSDAFSWRATHAATHTLFSLSIFNDMSVMTRVNPCLSLILQQLLSLL